MKYYTYAHQTADTGKIFYIGKGIGNRFSQKTGRNVYWKRIVAKHGFNTEILATWDSEEDAFEHEKLLIASFRSMGYELANFTDGGEGASGFKQKAESIAKRVAHYKGKSTNRKGTKLPEFHKVAISEGFNSKSLKNLDRSINVLCVETNQLFKNGVEAAKWLQSIGIKNGHQSNISRSAKKGIKAYGYSWRIA